MRKAIIIVMAVIAILVATLLTLNCFLQFAVTRGSSMSPTIHDGELLLVRKTGEIRDGDIIAFHSDRFNMVLIKRVIATEGERVRVQDGKVFRNGVMLIESYLPYGCTTQGNETEITVLPGQLYVMGDNRPVSQDSRTSGVGTISREDVVGVVMLRVWPLELFQLF